MIYFIHLPRTGGSFISQYSRHRLTKLRKQFNYWPPDYNKKKHAPARSIPDYEKHYLWGLVRNPFDWYVSQYFYFAGKDRKPVERDIFQEVDGGVKGTKFIAMFPTVKDWILYGLKVDLKYFWLNNLYDYMFCDEKGNNIMNFVGKFESMNHVMNFVLEENGLTPRVELKDFWGDKNESKHKNYREYYDEETKKIVFDKDEKLFKLYGYTY